MRLEDLDSKDWPQWAPYVDTLCIPVSRIRIPGKKPALQETKRVKEVSERLEQGLRGRLLLLPPIAYGTGDPASLRRYVEDVAREMASFQFHHLVFLTPDGVLDSEDREQGQDSAFSVVILEEGDVDTVTQSVTAKIVEIWESR
ncbi:DUF2487 family protein [Paludifilum halophilum]|uniref:DUF2487 domain-containing protein n=1 Tax=Paludifilum halophilum TaxID=1642702 RepID=A0A235BCL3_9BACL|nr:DUF2487 family protein [Paludifilum halophilum]OYD09707.1 hypothetical protein CHM34_01510 [Paludifilum halophilum]